MKELSVKENKDGNPFLEGVGSGKNFIHVNLSFRQHNVTPTWWDEKRKR